MTLLSQHVDTFKEALYFTGIWERFNHFVDKLIELKANAQLINHQNNDLRFVNLKIGSINWHVMAMSINGYSVVLKNGDVSMAFRKHAGVGDLNPSAKIEYRAHYLVKLGLIEAHKQVNNYFRDYIHSCYISKVQEIHIASDTQGHTFTHLDLCRFKTRSRKSNFFEGDDGELGRKLRFSSRRLESLYFGSSDLLLRIYDKRKEIIFHPDSGYIQSYWSKNPCYRELGDVWRVEFQIRREILKQIFTADGLPFEYTDVLLDNLPSLWSFFIKNFSYRDIKRDTALYILEGFKLLKDGSFKMLTKDAEKKIFQRSEIHPFWLMISQYNSIAPDYFFRFDQVKATSPVYAQNSASALISSCTKHYGHFEEWMIYEAFEGAEARCIRKNGLGMIDNAKKNTADYFNKVDLQRKLGLDVIEIDDAVKDNLAFYVADCVRPLIDSARLQAIF